MIWIKRNIFLLGFGVVAGGLLIFNLFYLWSSIAKNKAVETKVEETKQDLEKLHRQVPFPSRTNIAIAKEQTDRLRQGIAASQKYFAPVPFEKLPDKGSDRAFGKLLDTTIAQLQKQAEANSVSLPEKDYAFSFKAQKAVLTYAPGSFPTLPEQLAEIKALCTVLFDGKINKLVNIRRWRITADDPPGSSDYHEHDVKPVVNEGMGTVANPYELTFHSFSPELAQVLEGFYKSSHGLVVKSMAVDPVTGGEAAAGAGSNPAATSAPQPTNAPARPLPVRPAGAPPPVGVRPRPGTAAAAAAAQENLQTVLNEKLLKITLLVEVIKPVK